MKSRSARFPVIACAMLLLAACTAVLPRKAALDRIHDAYRADFMEAAALPPAARDVSRPGGGGDARQSGGGGDARQFAETLRLIAQYRKRFPADAVEQKHVTVLEGMIYLQSNRYGLARLLAPKVEAVSGQLDPDADSFVRDELFALNFVSLIDGWEAIAERKEDGVLFRRAADSICMNLLAKEGSGAPAPRWRTGPLTGICGNRLGNPASAALKPGDADEGALYLAATASIFYLWARESYATGCDRPGADSALLQDCRDLAWDAEWVAAGCTAPNAQLRPPCAALASASRKMSLNFETAACRLLQRFLTENERLLVLKGTERDWAAAEPGRLRFVRLGWHIVHKERAERAESLAAGCAAVG